ncbi:phosphoadenosine phosphosulfate reductase family protein [Pseudoalteromonas neustonica]|uniref:Phosphoadenosine phosphosulfate reductase family protein n=1 Tax=Pseudoalteromonas neustonica TaxID=1840331 RepID=A0ABU9U0P0_9GAMM
MVTTVLNTDKPYIVSFSGGRTSAYLVHLMEELKKKNSLKVHYVFMDTGLEHPKTYDFIKKVALHYKITLTCLRVVINKEHGKANSYKEIDISEIKHDLIPFKEMMEKYGTPYVRGPFCTKIMKGSAASSGQLQGPFYQWSNENFGEGNYIAVLGIRADEPKRLIGDENFKNLRNKGFSTDAVLELKNKLISLLREKGLSAVKSFCINLFDTELQPDLFNNEQPDIIEKSKKSVTLLTQRIKFLESKVVIYMADITDFEKQDVLNHWKKMPFDLDIPEWMGNCVWCIKKGANKLALASREEPELTKNFITALKSEDIKDKERQFGKLIMYRGNQSLESIIESYNNLSTAELKSTVQSSHQVDANSCSESCEALTCDFELEIQKDGVAA